MTEYIEREAISEGIRKYYYKNPPNFSYGEGFDRGLDRAQRAILDAPAADVAPVRHGRWEKEPPYTSVGGEYKKALICSQCHSFFVSDGNKPWQMHNYCPNCGAKMDLEADNHA